MAEKDIVMARRRADGDFEERVLASAPSSVAVFNTQGDLVTTEAEDHPPYLKLGPMRIYLDPPEESPPDGSLWFHEGFVYVRTGGKTVKLV